MKEIVSINKERRSPELHLTWYLSKLCNFNCSYCSDELHDNLSPSISEDFFSTALKNILKYPSQQAKIHLSGGEPFKNPGLLSFLEKLGRQSHFQARVGVTTNGSASLEKYLVALQHLSSLTISAHLEYLDIKAFVKKVTTLHSSTEVPMAVNLMFLPGRQQEVQELHQALTESGIETFVRRVRKKASSEFLSYTNEEDLFMQSIYQNMEPANSAVIDYVDEDHQARTRETSGNEVTLHRLNRFRDWLCKAGVNYFTIWNDGTVFPCEPNLEGKPSFGNIYDAEFSWPTSPTLRCPASHCLCLGDIEIPKWREKEVQT